MRKLLPSVFWMLLPLVLAAAPSGAVTVSTTIYATHDVALIDSGQFPDKANTNYWNSDDPVGCNFFGGPYVYSYYCGSTLWYFPLPADIAGRTVTSATLRLTVRTLAASYDTQYKLSAVAQDWTPAQVTFNTQPQVFIAGAKYLNLPLVGQVDVNVTDFAQQWASGAWPNYGMLMADTAFILVQDNRFRMTIFHSLELYDSPSQRPQLLLTYDAPDPVPAPVVQISADDAQISAGGSTTVRWQSTDALDCIFRGCGIGVGTCSESSATTSGTRLVSPAVSTEYEVSCTGDGGSGAATVTVTVVPEPGAMLSALAGIVALSGWRNARGARS